MPDLFRKIVALLIMTFFLAAVGGVTTASAASHEAAGSCCPADSTDSQPKSPCTDPGCSCTFCTPMELLPEAEGIHACAHEPAYHLRVPSPAPGDFISDIEYPPENA